MAAPTAPSLLARFTFGVPGLCLSLPHLQLRLGCGSEWGAGPAAYRIGSCASA